MEYRAIYQSPMGALLLTSDGEALTGLDFLDNLSDFSLSDDSTPVFDSAVQWLDSYFRGEPGLIDIPLSPGGTPFQKLIWQLLLEIPFGETRTYGFLAQEAMKLLKNEKMSARAVGQAVGRNPINIIVPCHRVIGAGGKLTGYSCGIHRKVLLLEHEQKNKEQPL